MTKAVTYARVSPRRNLEDSETIEMQLAKCGEYCKQRAYTVVASFEDSGISGSDEDRPGLWKAVEAVPRGGVLVAYKSDRLARSVFLDEYIRRELAKKKARVECVDGTNGDSIQDVMTRQILAAVSEAERKITAARTKAAMLYYQSEGRPMSKQPPFGKQPGEGGVWIEHPEEQAAIRIIRDYKASGLSNHRIARLLDERGVPCRGQHWHGETVRRVLLRS